MFKQKKDLLQKYHNDAETVDGIIQDKVARSS